MEVDVMKIQRMFSIDVELAVKLKNEKNASKIVNDLLKQHYQVEDNKQ